MAWNMKIWKGTKSKAQFMLWWRHHRAEGRASEAQTLQLCGRWILSVCRGVRDCHPTRSSDMTHGSSRMSGSPPSSLPPTPNGPSGPLPAWLGVLPNVSESFPVPGSSSAAIAAAARWQNAFPPLRLIELKVLHIHCCCSWTAASSQQRFFCGSFRSPSPSCDRTLCFQSRANRADGIGPECCHTCSELLSFSLVCAVWRVC